jgi:hypothetical protein
MLLKNLYGLFITCFLERTGGRTQSFTYTHLVLHLPIAQIYFRNKNIMQVN